jgi:hypothetical protein
MRLCVGTAKGIVILDAARHCAPIAVSANPAAVGCMAQSAGRPEILYAGSNTVAGSADFVPAAEADLGAMFRSEDGGRSWVEITGRTLHGEAFWALAAPHDEPAELWVGATHGRLFHSDDFGHSFAECLPFRDALANQPWTRSRAALTSHVVTICFDARDCSTLYVALADGGVFRTSDRGKTFRSLDRPIRRGLNCIAADRADSALLYAATDRGFFRSETGGRDWRRATQGLNRPYLHPVIVERRGVVYTAGAAGDPAFWIRGDGADALLFLSEDHGRTFKPLDGPQNALRGMVMQILPNPFVDGELLAVTSDGSVLRWTVGEDKVVEIASKLPPAFALTILP